MDMHGPLDEKSNLSESAHECTPHPPVIIAASSRFAIKLLVHLSPISLPALIAAVIPTTAIAQDAGVIDRVPPKYGTRPTEEPVFQPYEPNTGGYTKDDDDVGYLDARLSLKIRFPIMRRVPDFRLFLTMSTRVAFYWGSRPGSPVIGRSYNPKLLFRFLLPASDFSPSPDGNAFEYNQFLDLAYAHESNGQLIHSQDEYDRQLIATPPPQYTNNFIHRGWDYLEIAWKRRYSQLSVHADGKYFIPKGFLQGREDEYHPWENNSQGKPRKSVDGIQLSAAYPASCADFQSSCKLWPLDSNLTFRYLTGYDTPFRYDTLRAELGFRVLSIPWALWVQDGYMSSPAMYYVKVRSFGLEVRFNSF